jgi:hypothetical protein
MESITPVQYQSLKRLCVAETVLYGLVLCGIIHNIFVYCYKQSLYKLVTVSLFYLFAVMTIVCRLAQFSYLIFEAKKDKNVQPNSAMVYFASYASYSKLCIGWILCLFMCELALCVQMLKECQN